MVTKRKTPFFLRESKYKRHFQTFSGRSLYEQMYTSFKFLKLFAFQKVPNIAIWLGEETFGIYGKLAISLRRGGRLQEMVSTRGSTVVE